MEKESEICKNCGHEITFVIDEWFHASEDNFYFYKKCSYKLKGKKVKLWKENKRKEIEYELKREFGNYTMRYCDSDIVCACKNPEPDVERRKL